MQKSRKMLVERQQNVHTYSELWHASGYVLDAGLRDHKGSSWPFLSSLILTAFAFEAYVNHVGEQLNLWNHKERKERKEGKKRLKSSAKLNLLCEVLKVSLPADKRPRQTIKKLFKFRNALAHGRTETITTPPKRIDADKVDDHFAKPLLAEWQQLITDSSFAKPAREDVEAVILAIHKARPEPKDHPFTLGFGFRSATLER
jgi:hypothetical protein